MSEAPTEVWLRSRPAPVHGWYQTHLPDDPNAVRYVRADLYEALQARMAVVRSWNEAPCLEPLRAALEASEDNNASGAEQILRTAIKRAEAACPEPRKSVGEAS